MQNEKRGTIKNLETENMTIEILKSIAILEEPGKSPRIKQNDKNIEKKIIKLKGPYKSIN